MFWKIRVGRGAVNRESACAILYSNGQTLNIDANNKHDVNEIINPASFHIRQGFPVVHLGSPRGQPSPSILGGYLQHQRAFRECRGAHALCALTL